MDPLTTRTITTKILMPVIWGWQFHFSTKL